MRRFLSILFAIIMVLQLVGCGNTNVATNEAATNETKPDEAKIDEVILDNEMIKASYRGVVDMPDISYFYVNLNIENKMDKEIWVTLESADVDGETIPLVTSGTLVYIRPGNSYLATYGFPTMNLSIDSVKDAKEATFKIVVRDKENMTETIFESELITVNLTQ